MCHLLRCFNSEHTYRNSPLLHSSQMLCFRQHNTGGSMSPNQLFCKKKKKVLTIVHLSLTPVFCKIFVFHDEFLCSMEIHKHFKFNPIFIMHIWDYSVVRIAVYYRLGQSEDRISVGMWFSAPTYNSPGTHPASCTVVTVSLAVPCTNPNSCTTIWVPVILGTKLIIAIF